MRETLVCIKNTAGRHKRRGVRLRDRNFRAPRTVRESCRTRERLEARSTKMMMFITIFAGGETENMGVCTKERKGVTAEVLMATPCTNSLGGESGGHKHEGCGGR